MKRQNPLRYTLQEVADKLGCHKQTAWRWVNDGDLAAIFNEQKNRWEVTPAALRDFEAEFLEESDDED